MVLKIGILVSYDYEYLKTALPLVYDHPKVLEIILAIDKNRQTWTGNSFEIPDSFFEWIAEFDVKKKITIWEESFYHPDKDPMMSETWERNHLYRKMGKCDWYLQLDCDEYVIDFDGYVDELQRISIEYGSQPVAVRPRLAILFKKVPSGFLVISPIRERGWLATNNPETQYGRLFGSNANVDVDTIIIHQSWARSEEEIEQKVRNWGHSQDMKGQSFFNLWKVLDENNYRFIKDFHPMPYNQNVWEELKLLRVENASDFMDFSVEQMNRMFDKRRVINI
ncbi:hypothetical protein [Flavobacterium silvaticum]|uniref:Uncharacterized protein n=1 Tax=Flavobacterium silvaticum TaxID=1852020 RepID=A0A972FU16_9FLAO|nr:hypothetical protein [Flavobacterium silvaticum]NMH28012.1 hypothetical protein [Flavobacterium silvaticum]